LGRARVLRDIPRAAARRHAAAAAERTLRLADQVAEAHAAIEAAAAHHRGVEPGRIAEGSPPAERIAAAEVTAAAEIAANTATKVAHASLPYRKQPRETAEPGGEGRRCPGCWPESGPRTVCCWSWLLSLACSTSQFRTFDDSSCVSIVRVAQPELRVTIGDRRARAHHARREIDVREVRRADAALTTTTAARRHQLAPK